MTAIPHIPALRRGKIYESLDKLEVRDYRTGEVKATVSQVNAGIVRKDLQRLAESRAALREFTIAQFLTICAKAGEEFLRATPPMTNSGRNRPPTQYIRHR